jgi:NitT/TauT family transport system substrate-binding protein
MRRFASRRWLVVALACAALVAAGCGGDNGGGSSGGGGGSQQATTVKVGVIPIADVAPLFLGIKKGFFKQQRLNVKTQFAQGGAVIVPSVVSGDFQFGFSNIVSTLIADSKGLPLKIVAQGDFGASDPKKAWGVLLVKGNGPIKTAKDLEGKKIAVNTLNNICPVTINAALQKRGVDISKISYREIAFPDMLPALQKGEVSAACEVEPFVTIGKAQGNRGLAPFYYDTAPHLPVAQYLTTEKYISENPDVVRRFTTAMNKSLTYAEGHPGEVRAIIPTYTEIDKKTAQQIQLPTFSPQPNRAAERTIANYMVRYKLIPKVPNLDELTYTPQG